MRYPRKDCAVCQEKSTDKSSKRIAADKMIVSDPEKADETVHHPQESDTTRMERRSTHSKPLRPPKFVQVELFLSEAVVVKTT